MKTFAQQDKDLDIIKQEKASFRAIHRTVVQYNTIANIKLIYYTHVIIILFPCIQPTMARISSPSAALFFSNSNS